MGNKMKSAVKKIKQINKIETAFKKTREQTKLNGYGTDWNVNFSPGLY